MAGDGATQDVLVLGAGAAGLWCAEVAARGGRDRVSGANRLRHRARRLVRIVRVESRRYNRRRLRLYGREHRV